MIKAERLDGIVQFVDQNGYASVGDIISLTGASRATIHRDLETLSKAGRLYLTHGGAVSLFKNSVSERSYEEKSAINSAEKDRIAEYVASLIKPGDSVLVDSGTTTLRLVPFLRKIKGITVISNDAQIVTGLYDAPDINVKMIGGNLRKNYYSTIGYFAEEFVKSISADIGIISADAISENGFSIANDDEVGIKRCIIASSKTKIVMADHSKFGMDSFAKVCPLKSIDLIVTGIEAGDSSIVKSAASKCRIKFVE